MKSRWALLVLILIVLGCSRAEQRHKLFKLPSGHEVKLLGMGTMYFSEGKPALMLKYQTDKPIGDIPALEREADEIWQVFRVDVEKARMANAIISANEPTGGGFISRSKAFNFIYQKAEDGSWHRLPNK